MSRKAKTGVWVTILVILGIIVGCLIWYFNTASGERALKTMRSNNAGGLERVVKVYSDSGELIQTYEGKIDLQDTEYGNKVLFDLDGKRIVIYNATVISEEK
ncbi:hypothetical protein DC345_08235 [Paenibacillus taichungensis]|uniref:DUF5052 domain-containing protein n=1 Tax=Paenibacillus taichungensis TaxID=484184 RepID=A0A329QXW4_9BACL|nr:hypothetical protein [Paenibacillus taichungensis]RAW17077.1 hypothetical protein DC345_08235 [Paenibacillus taichungensis]